jgi:hypothetical protein
LLPRFPSLHATVLLPESRATFSLSSLNVLWRDLETRSTASVGSGVNKWSGADFCKDSV